MTLMQVALAAVLALQNGPPPGPPQGAPPGPPPGGPPGPPPGAKPDEPRGLVANKPGALPGYTLIAPLSAKTIRLVDLDGNVVHEWKTGFKPGSEIFLENGHLLRCCQDPDAKGFNAGGRCGRLQEIDWDGNVVWNWSYASDEHLQHHDIEVTPDGTILFVAYELKSRADCVAAGRHPTGISKDGIWSETIFEIEPVKPDGAEVLWEWHLWDHLIQDFDADAENHGEVAAHPELLDLNCDLRRVPESEADLEEMKKIGYVANNATRGEISGDWIHMNAIDYDAEHDQILVSSPHLNEIFILDHSTTTDEASGHTGGKQGHGGDFLWRWGNPSNYGMGLKKDQRLFGQHDPRWIRKGLPGAGHVTVFDNGPGRPDGNYSSIEELVLPRAADGSFVHEEGLPFGPTESTWRYVAPNKTDFFSGFISGATRLSNGNTLICEGATGRVLEVTAAGETVWEYRNPFAENDPSGGPGGGAPPFAMFRATRIPAEHPGLKGKKLAPIRAD
jgi:hypothetical protein